MQILDKIKQILSEILDVDENEIKYETYLVRELDAESIDLLEAALEFSSEFKIEIKEDDIFLRNLRVLVEQAEETQKDPVETIVDELAHIDRPRLVEMVEELSGGPVLQVGDLERYIRYVVGDNHGV